MQRAAEIFWDFFWLIAVAIWLVAFVGNAHAEPPPLIITEAGYYQLTVGDDGAPRHVKIETVIDLTGGNAPEPDDPDEPDVDPNIVRDVETWSDDLDDPQTSQAIAAVYSHVRAAVADGTLPPSIVWQPLRIATDCALVIVEPSANWEGFRKKLSAVVTEGRQRGTIQTADDIRRFLVSVQHGLELSADGSTALELDILSKIAAKTNEAIDDAK